MQDDGHIFCLPSQAAGEIQGVLDLVEEIMSAFGFNEYEVTCNYCLLPKTQESEPCESQALIPPKNL